MNKNVEIQEMLLGRYFRAEVATGLRWGDLLNTDPPTLALMNDVPNGCAAKTRTLGMFEGRHWGYSFLFCKSPLQVKNTLRTLYFASVELRKRFLDRPTI